MFRLEVDGERVELDALDPSDTTTVTVHDEHTENGYGPYCRHCGDTIHEDSDAGWLHDDTEDRRCDADNLDDEDDNTSDAEPEPLAWCNSARVTLDPDDDAVHVSISVGDPRGAFVMTVRRTPRGLIMHLPHPGEPLPHVETHELHPGTFAVGWTPEEAER